MTATNQPAPEWQGRAPLADVQARNAPVNQLTAAQSRKALSALRKGARPRARKAKEPREPKAVPPRFAAMLTAAALPLPVTEHRFHPTRLWRFDYAWPSARVALEVDGGIWVNGGHNRGAQMLKTWEKENTAAAFYGWRILRCEPKGLCSAEMLAFIEGALLGNGLSIEKI